MDSRRRALAAMLLVMLAVACSGDRQKTGVRDPRRPPVSPAAAPVASPPASSTPQAASSSPRAPRTEPGAASPGGAPAGSSSPAAGADAPARPGRYIYDETGVRRIRACFVVDEPAATPTSLRVDPAAGSRQTWVRDRRSALGTGSLTTTTLEFRPDGIFIISLRQLEVAALASSELAFEPALPVLAFPARPVDGQTWSFTLDSKDGRATLSAENAVEAADEPVGLVGGGSARAARIWTSTHLTGPSDQGSLDIRETYASWLSLADRIVVKEVRDTQGRAGVCELSWHLEALLRSLTGG
ncbi:MAG: hypothetical protein ACRDJ4_16080 [Actinomycetota bacterium]